MDAGENLQVRWVQGLTSNNVGFVDRNTVCYTCGNYIVSLNMDTKTRNVLLCSAHGIGIFSANGLSGSVAFSEQKLHPSIFVYSYPELNLRCEIKGSGKLAYTALTLSDAGTYLAFCSSLPDNTITVWNWEIGVPLCSQSLAEEDITTLVFNPINWQQICAINSRSLTVWNIERSNDFHVMKGSVIDLPASGGSTVELDFVASHLPGQKLTYYGPQMPAAAVAGLIGDRAETFVPQKQLKPRLSPCAVCWSASSCLYVGSKEGYLLLVNPETLFVSILYKPHITGCTSDSSGNIPGQDCCFQCLALHDNELFATGRDGYLRKVQIKENQIDVLDTWTFDIPVSTVYYSPNYETLLLSSNTGYTYRCHPKFPDKVDKVLDVLRGDFVDTVPLYTEKDVCVSVRKSGHLQVWSLDAGSCIASISLQTNVSSLACCPIAQYVAVGTVTGHVLFVDLTSKQQPRIVHSVHLYHVPVQHLVFDQGANFLFSAASDPHIFILSARPSKMFEIIGYTEALGATVSLTTQYQKEDNQVKVLVLCNGEEKRKDSELKTGNLLQLLSISIQQIKDSASFVDRRGCLCEDVIQQCVYKTPQSLSSCVMGAQKVFGYCSLKKALQSFQLPEMQKGKITSSNQEAISLSPEQEVESHSLGPASVHLSSDQSWLASVGRDGLFCIYNISTMERYVQIQCHSYWLGGVRSVCFSADSQTVITTGLRDGCLVCCRLRSEVGQANAATQYSTADSFKVIKSSENTVLSAMSDWTKSSQGWSHMEQIQEDGQEANDIHEDAQSNFTWLENRLDTVLKRESQQFTETRKNLKKNINELQDKIKTMMLENESLPDMEKLQRQDFNLDMEEQKRIQAKGVQEVARVREETELENLATCYLLDVLKKECWNSMIVKETTVKAFHSKYEVKNYPMRERTANELEELHRVETIRKTEMAETTDGTLEKSKAPGETEDEEEEKKAHGSDNSALVGSLSAQYGGSKPYLYSQVNLDIRERIIKQIIMLQDVIYKVKTAFNTEFDLVYKQKLQEINRVRDKNKRITEIMVELNLTETLWEPTMTDNERPETALTISDSEIKVDKYVTLEEKAREEEEKRKEEQSRLAAKDDNIRKRALQDMMGGVLEVRKEDILTMEVPEPEFMAKPELQWTEEERRKYREYEKTAKELREEQEKYRKMLEVEMKKLQASIKDATQAFDETMIKLFERKVKSDMSISQEELKIANLVYCLLIEEEILNREKELSDKLERAKTGKSEIVEAFRKHRQDVETFRDTYDSVVAEDKGFDRGFRKEFFDVPGHLVDQLYRLYKRRPRAQRMRMQTDISPFKERPLSDQAAAEGFSQMMRAMKELDALENMPEGLDPAIWEKFCLARRAKVESEQQVKIKALTLAEMQAFLQRRTEEEDNTQMEINSLVDHINSLREDRIRFVEDIMVQILIKQGQVELESGHFVADYSDSLLLHRHVIEDLNRAIGTIGEQKIASMVECKDIRKGIIQQEWEHKRMKKQLEDLNTKARDIQLLRVTQELQEYLSETHHDSRMSKQVSTPQKSTRLQDKNIDNCKKLIKQLNRQTEMKKAKNAALDMNLASMQVAVAERRHLYGALAMEETEESEALEHYKYILQRKKLVNIAKAQTAELALLTDEVERWRMKTFPAFSHLTPK